MASNNRNYRPWMSTEDDKLVEALLDMVNTTRYRADNGFKSGYLQHLECVLKESLPDSSLLAKPHIESRMKTLKRDWQTFYDMLNASGFGYDKGRNTVSVTHPVWDDYVKGHKHARKWKGKMLPHYEELCVIFGKDRAQGDKAKLPYQMEEDINIEEQNQQIDEDFEEEGSHNATTNSNMNVDETSSSRTKKRKKPSQVTSLLESFNYAVLLFGDRMKESSIQLTEGLIKYEIDMENKTLMITSELSKMASLSQLERFRALKKITSDPQNLRNFWALEEHERAE